MTTAPAPETWGSRTGFILATVGSAVGVGSIWKFPYEVGANGGGAFVVVYLLGLAFVVVPLMLVELAIGRRGGGDAATALERVAVAEQRSPRWRWIGLGGALTAFVILSYYSVIGGWTISYTVDTARDGLPSGGVDSAAARFDDLLASPWRLALFHGLFMAAVAAVVLRGIRAGIEAAMKILMPVLGILLVALAVYAMANGAAGEAARFLFVPHFDELTTTAVLDALGLGFFSIGVGLGLMITYAAFSPPGVNLRQVAIVSVMADSAVSLVAGLAVFPIVFAHGLDPAGGPGLVFVTLPVAFAEVPLARVVAVAFFVLLFVAALGSAISMLEAVVAPLEQRRGWSRRRSVLVGAAACWLAGMATVLSFNEWAGWAPLGWIGRFDDSTVFDLLDGFTSNFMLPAGGLALAVFVAWVGNGRAVSDELGLSQRGSRWLRALVRYVVPVAIVAATIGALAD